MGGIEMRQAFSIQHRISLDPYLFHIVMMFCVKYQRLTEHPSLIGMVYPNGLTSIALFRGCSYD
jgi:hypothetical protein